MLEQFLVANEREREVNSLINSVPTFLMEINQSLDKFETMERVKHKEAAGDPPFSALKWWQGQKQRKIYEPATILTCLPSTQVSVERLFSSLSYILSDKRGRLTADTLESILFLRVNGVE